MNRPQPNPWDVLQLPPAPLPSPRNIAPPSHCSDAEMSGRRVNESTACVIKSTPPPPPDVFCMAPRLLLALLFFFFCRQLLLLVANGAMITIKSYLILLYSWLLRLYLSFSLSLLSFCASCVVEQYQQYQQNISGRKQERQHLIRVRPLLRVNSRRGRRGQQERGLLKRRGLRMGGRTLGGRICTRREACRE